MDKPRLGRGLEALLSETDSGGGVAAMTAHPQNEVPLDQIQRNPFQPRKNFDQEDLTSLCASVKTHGILQPLVVRQLDGRYQLVAGERRLRAAHDAGLATVPVRVVDFNDQEVLEAALIENIQRSDLNPIEKAQGFKEYLDRFHLNHDQLAHRLGLARSSITNLVGLLDLAKEVQEGIRVSQISEAHAKLLKGIKNKDRQVALFKQIVAMGLSVKATEALVRDQKEVPTTESSKPEPAEEKTSHVRSLEDELRQRLATPVEIRLRGKEKGQFLIRFENNDDFMRILEALRK